MKSAKDYLTTLYARVDSAGKLSAVGAGAATDKNDKTNTIDDNSAADSLNDSNLLQYAAGKSGSRGGSQFFRSGEGSGASGAEGVGSTDKDALISENGPQEEDHLENWDENRYHLDGRETLFDIVSKTYLRLAYPVLLRKIEK